MTTRARCRDGADGYRVPRLLRPSGVAVQVKAIARLAALKARVDGFGPDDWQVMEALHGWALGLPHEARMRWLAELGGHTDDLWVGLDETTRLADQAAVAR